MGSSFLNMTWIPQSAAAAEELKAAGDEEIYVVTCFSDRDKFLKHVEKEG